MDLITVFTINVFLMHFYYNNLHATNYNFLLKFILFFYYWTIGNFGNQCFSYLIYELVGSVDWPGPSVGPLPLPPLPLPAHCSLATLVLVGSVIYLILNVL